MLHLDEERTQRLIDGELGAPAESEARAHLNECRMCRERAESAMHDVRDVHARLAAIDEVLPTVLVDEVVTAARAPVEFPVRRPVSERRLRWAAGFAIALLVAGVAYALPGSPLRMWIEKWDATRAPELRSPEVQEAGRAGIAVLPGDHLILSFRTADRESRVEIRLTDDPYVIVRAPAGAATFTSEIEHLRIDNSSAATFEVLIPRTAPWVEIRVADRVLYEKLGPHAPFDGPVVLPLAP